LTLPTLNSRTTSWAFAILSLFIQSSSAAFSYDSNCPGSFEILNEIDYERDVQPIFDEHCVLCHQPGTATYDGVGLNLLPGHSFWSLIAKRSAQGDNPPLVSVIGSTSFLLEKLVCLEPAVGDPMPPDRPRLSQEELDRIVSWTLLGPLPEAQTQRSVNSQPELAGSWYNPETPGQGQVVEFIARDGFPRVLLYWFTFADDGSQQRWYVADGLMSPFEAIAYLTIYQSSGGAFDRAEPPANIEKAGEAVLKFESCTEASFAYRLDSSTELQADLKGQIQLHRLSPVNGCED
jgi:hypothetical protein